MGSLYTKRSVKPISQEASEILSEVMASGEPVEQGGVRIEVVERNHIKVLHGDSSYLLVRAEGPESAQEWYPISRTDPFGYQGLLDHVGLESLKTSMSMYLSVIQDINTILTKLMKESRPGD